MKIILYQFKKTVYTILILIVAISCHEENKPANREYPRMSTLDATDVDKEGVTLVGAVDYLNSPDEIIDHGFIYNTSPGPDIRYDHSISLGGRSTVGTFNARIESGLYKTTNYYFASYVKTKDYVVYGNERTFKSIGSKGPILSKVTPAIGVTYDTLIISGKYFISDLSEVKVYFDDYQSHVIKSTDTTITCVVPLYERSAAPKIKVVVTGVEVVRENLFTFIPPLITEIVPSKGFVGDTIAIKGNYFGYFNYDLSVSVGNSTATIISATKNLIKVKIPASLNKVENAVSVKRKNLTSNYNINFTLLPL